MSPLWRVRFKVFTGGHRQDKNGKSVPVSFGKTIHEIDEPDAAAARRHARRIMLRHLAKCRCVVKSVKRDRDSEVARERRSASA